MANLILVTQAAQETSYSVTHIRSLLQQKIVKGEKVGGVWLVDIDELRAYEQRMQELGQQKFRPKTSKKPERPPSKATDVI